MKLSRTHCIFGSLIGLMVLIKIFDLVFNPNKIFPGRIAVFPWLEILITLVLGIIGLFLYKKTRLPGFEEIRKRKAIIISIGAGLGFSILLVIIDAFARIGDISVGWPLSIIFYIWGSISTEIIFRLFAISLIVWLFSNVIFRKKHNTQIYWIGSAILSLIVVASMVMGLMQIANLSILTLLLIGIIVIISELASFKLLRKYGFLSNLVFRMSFYLIWHILWPVVFY